jgi:hypothetical protein
MAEADDRELITRVVGDLCEVVAAVSRATENAA